MAFVLAASRGQLSTLQAAGSTTGNGTVLAIPDSFNRHTITIKGSAGIASGAVQVEAADVYNYSGTWAPIGGGPVSAVASASLQVTFNGLYRFIRARISTNIGGGTIGVTYEGS